LFFVFFCGHQIVGVLALALTVLASVWYNITGQWTHVCVHCPVIV